MRVSSAATNADVAKFNFDDLEKIANGKYNKGEVLLSKDGKLMTVNNHVSMTSWNDIVSTPEQNRAVREAVAKALTDQYEQFSTVADYERRNSSEAAKAVAEFLTDESNQNLPLSRDELRKLLQICTPQYRSSADEGIKYQGDFETELDVIREFGQAKRSADETKLNAFVGTLNEKLGDSSARLGTDIQSWVKGLSVANLDAKTRATVLKQSDNQNYTKVTDALMSFDLLATAAGITKPLYNQLKSYSNALSDIYSREANKFLLPDILNGKAPSQDSIRRFLLSISQKGPELGAKMNIVLKDDGDESAFAYVAHQDAFFGMFAKTPMVCRAFVANTALATNANANLGAASDQLEVDSRDGDAAILAAASLAGNLGRTMSQVRGAYIFSLPKKEAVEELWRLVEPKYMRQFIEKPSVSINDALQCLADRDTPESNDIMKDFFQQVGAKVLDNTLRPEATQTTDFLYVFVLSEDLPKWFATCAQNRALNAALGTDAYQPVWVMGSEEDDKRLRTALKTNLGAKHSSFLKEEADRRFFGQYVNRPTAMGDALKQAVRANPKLLPLIRATFIPPGKQFKQHFNRAGAPANATVASTMSQIVGEIKSQIEAYVPFDVELTPEVRKDYVKLAVEMYLYNNPHVSRQALQDVEMKNNIFAGFRRNILVSDIKDGIEGPLGIRIKNAFPGWSNSDCKAVRDKIFDEIKNEIKQDSSDGWEDRLADRVKERLTKSLGQDQSAFAQTFRENSQTLIDLAVEQVRSAVDAAKSTVGEKIEKAQAEHEEVYVALNEIAMEEQGGANINNVNHVD